MNQMVDRKARNLLTIDTLFISLIIGKIIVSQNIIDFKLVIFGVAGITCLASMIYSMFAITLERTHGKLCIEGLSNKKGNPLFFGNFRDINLKDYKKAMLSMSDNITLVHNSIIEDIFYLGKALERKRLLLNIDFKY